MAPHQSVLYSASNTGTLPQVYYRRSHHRTTQQIRFCTTLAALWILALACCSLSATAALRMAGNAPHASRWQRVYDDLPAAWKTERTVVVLELSDAEMAALTAPKGDGRDRHAADGWVVDGCYQSGGDTRDTAGTIRICERLRGQAAELIFAHEYGHFIWLEKLTQAQRNAYKQLWRRQKRARHLVTEYAAEDVQEGFAEALAYFLRQPAALRRHDRESYRFLCDLLGQEKAPGEA